MTWLSLKSGIASIGARSMAHKPQPAIPIQSTTTRNRLRSESSMRRSIMVSGSCDERRNTGRTGIPNQCTHLCLRIDELGERHQETQFRGELRRQVRSEGRNEACTVPGASAAEPRTRVWQFACTALPEAMLKRPLQPAPAHEASTV